MKQALKDLERALEISQIELKRWKDRALRAEMLITMIQDKKEDPIALREILDAVLPTKKVH